jgi:arsenate reductase
MSSKRPKVLFLCVHNAGRSQMAAALLAERAGDRIVVNSAGSAPGETLNPAVVAAMAEVGIDISREDPKRLTDDMGQQADVIVTMGCGDECSAGAQSQPMSSAGVYPGKRYLDWELTDPAGKSVEEVRPIRDEIAARVEELAAELIS